MAWELDKERTLVSREAQSRLPTAQFPDAETHSRGFRQTRAARRNALLEDYVELIADLIADGGEARQVDIAARLGVAQPTVAKALRRLIAEGLVVQKPYRGVFLTEPDIDSRSSAARSCQRTGRLYSRRIIAAISTHWLLERHSFPATENAPFPLPRAMSSSKRK